MKNVDQIFLEKKNFLGAKMFVKTKIKSKLFFRETVRRMSHKLEKVHNVDYFLKLRRIVNLLTPSSSMKIEKI